MKILLPPRSLTNRVNRIFSPCCYVRRGLAGQQKKSAERSIVFGKIRNVVGGLLTRSFSVEVIGDVQDLDIGSPGLFQARSNLQDAAWIGGDHDPGARLENVLDLAALQPFRHGRFGEIIASGAAAANIGLAQIQKVLARPRFDQLTRRFGDPLSMSKMAGIMKCDMKLMRGLFLWRGFFQNFRKVQNLRAEGAGSR